MKPPIETIHLFPRLNHLLISFLRTLAPDQWMQQTVAREWNVKDVASHLLDGNFRRIALHRDAWAPKGTMRIESHTDLVNYLNTINRDWVTATKRLSSGILVELLENTNGEVYNLFKDLAPFKESVYPVGWAGETVSYNWFDIAREYTERWLHQHQIRDALGNSALLTDEFYHPFLTIAFQAWPITCASVSANEGTVLKATITGTGGGDWYLVRQEKQWILSTANQTAPVAETIIDGNLAWKLFSKSIRKENVREGIEIKGNAEFGEQVLNMVSVMA